MFSHDATPGDVFSLKKSKSEAKFLKNGKIERISPLTTCLRPENRVSKIALCDCMNNTM